MRDDFTKVVIEALAKRVGFICSNPSCGQLTVGPQEEPSRTITIGVAAHMTAAAPGGPRYDSALSSDERRSITNGIWLCQSCAKLIDSDETRFTVQLLGEWKARAELQALEKIHGAVPVGTKVATLRHILTGHTNFVWDVAVTPDGRRAVSVSNDRTVRMWDIPSGNLLATLKGHQAFVCSLSLSRTGNLVATGAVDGTIKVWALDSGELRADWYHGTQDAKVAWGPGENQLLSGGADGCLESGTLRTEDANGKFKSIRRRY
jgi:WD40 repeat protein